MNTIFTQIQKIFLQYKGVFLPHTTVKKGIRPIHDWTFALISFFIGFVCVSIITFYINSMVEGGDLWSISTNESSIKSPSIDQKKFDQVLDLFAQKEKNRASLGGGLVSDPSL